jgi:hypothetical protein
MPSKTIDKQSVDPTNIPTRLTQAQKEWFILFSLAVAGKGARQTERKLNALLESINPDGWGFGGPFAKIEYLIVTGQLMQALKEFKFGQYNRIYKAFTQVTKMKAPYTVQGLMGIDGIGPKTASFIHLYTNPKADCVPLDTHILKYLRAQGYDAPKSTPQAGIKYDNLEKQFQSLAKKQGKTVRQLDTEVWNYYHEKHANLKGN